jgi:predicted ArsR family transcriptional regulator
VNPARSIQKTWWTALEGVAVGTAGTLLWRVTTSSFYETMLRTLELGDPYGNGFVSWKWEGSMTADDLAARIAGVSALADPVRRSLYQFVVRQPGPVGRDQAAAGLALPRHTAKFHLDRLVEEGLLATEFRRLSGRRGPGAGRPAKLYRRAERQVAVSLPERRYDLAARLLARAVERAADEGTPVRTAVAQAAAEEGRRLAALPGEQDRTPIEEVTDVLAHHGYEPRVEGEVVVLANCPFSDLARDHTALVCGMNLDLLTAFLAERGYPAIAAELDPADGRCCVTLVSRLV